LFGEGGGVTLWGDGVTFVERRAKTCWEREEVINKGGVHKMSNGTKGRRFEGQKSGTNALFVTFSGVWG